MVTMNADKWIFLLAMCFMCVSSQDELSYAEPYKERCKTQTLSATLGSSVVLPCNLGAGNSKLVTWTYNMTNGLIHLSPGGQIKFLDHRYGRLKAFPNQGSMGNYSICIDELKKSDFGSYVCEQEPYCLQVDLLFKKKSYKERCKTQTLSATLGSSVVLPCNLGAGNNNLVTWTHNMSNGLIHLSPGGRIKFLDHRYGRVKAFPNQGLTGNYSICIDELKMSDIGYYHCEQEPYCLQVDLVFGKSAMSDDTWLLIYISVCVAALILLSACSYLCWMKCIMPRDNKTQDNGNISVIPTDFRVASAPPEEPVSVPVQEQQIGVGNNDLVYENDFQSPANSVPTRAHYGVPGLPPNPGSGMYEDMTQPSQSASGMYPDLTRFTIERVESRRTRQRFHIDLISRIRQASLSRHYYVNRDEINKQHAMSAQAQGHPRGVKKKKASDNCEYKNPIYNRSTEYLNQL